MAAYRRVYGFDHLRADCRGPGSKPYTCVEYGTAFMTDQNPLVEDRAGKNIFFFKLGFYVTILGFFRVLTYNCRTQNYDPQAKIRPHERHKSQFTFEYHLYRIKSVTQVKEKEALKNLNFLLEVFRFLKT